MSLKFTLFSFLFLLFSFSINAQQTVTGTIMHDGTERNYRLYIPDSYSESNPAPLVFNLHGFTSNAVQQEIYSEMDAVADAEGFLVCYPDGVASSWNVGWAFGSNEDDVGFISKLIDEINSVYNVNLKKVYSCGMSNGGFMSYRLACELNDRIAAIASVTGSMSPQFFPTCSPGKAVPVMEIHGTADPTVPYNGSPDVAVGIEEVVDFWVANNGCETEAEITEIENISVLDLSTATRFDYSFCENDSKVSFIKITNGAHTWPGASIIIGTTNQDFEASVEIWKFFNQFELDNPTSAKEEAGNNKINIYPNPAGGVLNIGFEKENIFEFYEIYDAYARLIKSGEINGRNNLIEIYELAAGAYVLKLSDGDKVGSRVFIKR
ncbi:MAG TPA: T9SS type A sorting domain-containing protein [Bacteroidetes bacterium]|nr:T9SS type A sorting domain-containing protein [Bacteroidota bacterium]